ncbi:Aste57867_10313 [Aphanomyces stellatus]|uniref:Aste57867_10313 protein n=1 Tax=Aphanomyces stellatus TaxID=120398 RepID=A0A485KQ41_9STRA|nr:hypothetical protein As57867_010273 [Aphanomyces stellatus]VFT87187.1 Aste57867_10313 [Aphanomyces stellatus]
MSGQFYDAYHHPYLSNQQPSTTAPPMRNQNCDAAKELELEFKVVSQVVMDHCELFPPLPFNFATTLLLPHEPYHDVSTPWASHEHTQTLHGNFVLNLDMTTSHTDPRPCATPTHGHGYERHHESSHSVKVETSCVDESSATVAESDEVPGQCLTPGCATAINYRGHCKNHGGVRKCSVVGCNKGNQGKKRCINHGGGKRCTVATCEKSAQSQGLCKAHGGGARCTIQGCGKSSQGGGFCRKHGGGRRCERPGCNSGAQRLNLCAKHGGSRQCKQAGCGRTDRGGGLCENHRKSFVCPQVGCNRLGSDEYSGLCAVHGKKPPLDL